MADDPIPSQTEGALQEWAARRRREFGAPLELSAATRAALLGTARRSGSGQRPGFRARLENLWRWFLNPWPIVATCSVLLVGFMFWIRSSHPRPVEMSRADALHSSRLAEPAFKEAAPESVAPAPQAATAPKPSPGVSSGRFVRVETPRPSRPNDYSLAMNQRKLEEKSKDMDRVAAGSERQVQAESLQNLPSLSLYQNIAVNPSSRARSLDVLNEFSVVQDGSVIRVVDRDGSVYAGKVLSDDLLKLEADSKKPAAAEKRNGSGIVTADSGTTVTRKANRAAVPAEEPAARRREEAAAGGRIGGAAQASSGISQQGAVINFSVVGQNKTLNQPVTFHGALYLSNEALPLFDGNQTSQSQSNIGQFRNFSVQAQNVSGALPQAQNTGIAQQQLFYYRVAGRAQVGKTNELKVEALPVSPSQAAPQAAPQPRQ